MKAFIIAFALTVTAAPAAENSDSANSMMPHCRGFIASESSPDNVMQAWCVAMVRGMVFMGSILRDQVKAEGDRRLPCINPPPGVTPRQSVVVAYIDARPARMHEHFGVLALEALRSAWPCR